MFKRESTFALTSDSQQLCETIRSVPENKRRLVTLIAESFINGMTAQQQLSQTPHSGNSRPPLTG